MSLHTRPPLRLRRCGALLKLHAGRVDLLNVTRTLLVVDDDTQVRQLVRRVVRKDFDAELLDAEHGLAAIDVLMSTRVDLMLLDISMPIMDGLETLSAIRRVPQLIDLPTLVLAGQAEGEQVQQLIRLGIAGFLVKPFRPSLLSERLGAILTHIPVLPALPARPGIGGLSLDLDSHVLLLDDNREFCEVFTSELSRFCNVTIAKGATDALERCTRNHFDGIFVGSLEMGLHAELFARKARLASRGAPIVALASVWQCAAVEAGGLYEFTILRSFLPDVLRTALRSIMAPRTIARWVLAPTAPTAEAFADAAATHMAHLIGHDVGVASRGFVKGRRVRAVSEVQVHGLSWRLSAELPYASALAIAEAELKLPVDQISEAHAVTAVTSLGAMLGEALVATTGRELPLELTPPTVEILELPGRDVPDDAGIRSWMLSWGAAGRLAVSLVPLAARQPH